MNIVDQIKARAYGDRIAIREGDVEISFDTLFSAVDEVRGQLLTNACFQQSGVPRIGVYFPNGLGYIVVALAVLETGACFVPIPDELTECECEDLIQQTALHGVVSVKDEDDTEEVIDLPCGWVKHRCGS